MTKSTSGGYDQFETSPEANDQELRTAFCERRQTDRLKTNYRIDEQYATVGVLRDLIKYRDGLYDIHYFTYDDITAIIDELCTN